MAGKRKNRPMRPGEEPSYDDSRRGGGGGGGNRNKNRDRNRNDNRHQNNKGGGGGGGGGGGTDVTTPGENPIFAVQDPGAWLRSAMGSAGFAPNDATNYGRFLTDAIITPFVSGWNEWQASHPTATTQDFYDYARSRGMGLPDSYLGGPPALAPVPPGSVPINKPLPAAPLPTPINKPALTPAPVQGPINKPLPGGNAFASTGTGLSATQPKAVMGFDAFQQAQTQGPNLNTRLPGLPKLGNGPDANQPLPGKKPPALPGPAPAPAGDWAAFNAWLQNEVDKFTPQQQGRYDAGKRPGSIRWNQFS